MIMRPYRDSWAATKYIANPLTRSPIFPERITTTGLAFYTMLADDRCPKAGAVRRVPQHIGVS